ncbi:hypothetical protein D7X48_11745 [bacterium D16-50]|nr:hypothetical protein D7X48_11745 [bacterium D16-50]
MNRFKTFFSSFRNALISIVCAMLAVTVIGTGVVLAAGAGRRDAAMDRNTAFGYALADAGLSEQDVTVTKQKLHKDGETQHYDIEFFTEKYDYSYEIDAFSGAVLDVSMEALFDKPQASSGIGAGDQQTAGQPGQDQSGQQTAGQPGQDQSGQQTAGQPGQNQSGQQTAGQPGQDQSGQQTAGQPGQDQSNQPTSGQSGQDQGNQPNSGQQGLLDLETVKALALADAGVKADTAVFTQSELEWEDGVQVYDLEFRTSEAEYDYEINAVTGAIISKDAEGRWNNQGGPVDLEGAKAVALADAGVKAADAVFRKSELEWEDGVKVYDIEFYTSEAEYDYEINASTGAVLDKSMELFENHVPSADLQGSAGSYIGVDQAKAIAVSNSGFKAEDVIFTKTKLERDKGSVRYEVEFYKDRMEYEYSIDAYTGSILEYESEYDD